MSMSDSEFVDMFVGAVASPPAQTASPPTGSQSR